MALEPEANMVNAGIAAVVVVSAVVVRSVVDGSAVVCSVVKSVVAEVADVSMGTDESETSTEETDVLLEDTEISTVVSTTVEGVADASPAVQ